MKESSDSVTKITDSMTNLSNEERMNSILETKLEKGDYSMSSTSTTTNRGFSNSSMANDYSSTPSNTKRS